jgi:hypothetical protein
MHQTVNCSEQIYIYHCGISHVTQEYVQCGSQDYNEIEKALNV